MDLRADCGRAAIFDGNRPPYKKLRIHEHICWKRMFNVVQLLYFFRYQQIMGKFLHYIYLGNVTLCNVFSMRAKLPHRIMLESCIFMEKVKKVGLRKQAERVACLA